MHYDNESEQLLLAFSFLCGKENIFMKLFYPDAAVDKVYDIDADFFDRYSIQGLILDVDNTLTTHNNPIPDKAVLKWLDMCKKSGISWICAKKAE